MHNVGSTPPPCSCEIPGKDWRGWELGTQEVHIHLRSGMMNNMTRAFTSSTG